MTRDRRKAGWGEVCSVWYIGNDEARLHTVVCALPDTTLMANTTWKLQILVRCFTFMHPDMKGLSSMLQAIWATSSRSGKKNMHQSPNQTRNWTGDIRIKISSTCGTIPPYLHKSNVFCLHWIVSQFAKPGTLWSVEKWGGDVRMEGEQVYISGGTVARSV